MEKNFQQRMQQVEGLIRKIENVSDPEARESALALIQSLMDFHGASLERLMEVIAEEGEAGYVIFDKLARDGLVASLLLLYGLHPVDLQTRVTQALDKVRPYLDSHGGNVELLGITDGVVRLRLQGSCKSCPSSAMTLKLAIEEAIYAAAPDVVGIEAEGVSALQPQSGLVQVERPHSNGDVAHSINGNNWEEVGNLQSLAQSAVQIKEVRGRPVLFCRLGEALYAYGNDCPACGQSLESGHLETTNFVCGECGTKFDVIRAGRGLDKPSLHLEPYPLLVEHGLTKIALPPLLANQGAA